MIAKLIIAMVVGILSFAGTVAGVMYLNGELSEEKLLALRDPEAFAKAEADRTAEEKEAGPSLNTLADQLNQRERELEKRRTELDEREKQLAQRESDLARMRTDLEALQASINQSMDAAAESRTTQLKTIAITLEGMDAKNAAQTLETMPTDEAAEILLGVQDKKRGAILDEMTTETAARILKEMRGTR